MNSLVFTQKKWKHTSRQRHRNGNTYRRFVWNNLKLETAHIIVEYSYSGILLNNTKELSIDTYVNMDETQNNHAESKKSEEIVLFVWFHLHKIIGYSKNLFF